MESFVVAEIVLANTQAYSLCNGSVSHIVRWGVLRAGVRSSLRGSVVHTLCEDVWEESLVIG